MVFYGSRGISALERRMVCLESRCTTSRDVRHFWGEIRLSRAKIKPNQHLSRYLKPYNPLRLSRGQNQTIPTSLEGHNHTIYTSVEVKIIPTLRLSRSKTIPSLLLSRFKTIPSLHLSRVKIIPSLRLSRAKIIPFLHLSSFRVPYNFYIS